MNSVFPWSCETNWVIAHGSLRDSITVEFSDDPIDESVAENLAPKSPLILKPRCPDSAPCEIKICFEKKYEVGQVYVRSTARTYEIYCTHSAHSISEYLCTVRCGVAERDDKILQTNYVEDLVEKHGEGRSEEVTAETATNGGIIGSGEDDWINIKVPEGGRSSFTSASDEIGTTGLNNVQDFYEATAQISDSEPCLSLTIRLLSLQDKGHVYVDEVYVFLDPVESTDCGNEAVLAGNSAQSSLMAMFMPTLLQLSKPGLNRIQDKCASDEVLKDAKMENGSRIIGEVDCHQQYAKPKELDKDMAESSKLQDTAESSELQQLTSAKKPVEPIKINDPSPGHLETALEQLISRMSRVEEVCLRFEEKMLKPIESLEARLQRVEDQLEKLAKNSNNFGLPNCTRISAPAFSCSESNSSSLYYEQSDYPPRGPSDLEKKDFSGDNMPGGFSCGTNFHPSLVVSAPEFSCGEGEEKNDDLKPLKDSPRIKPKITLSLDEAVAASLDGFLSSTASHPSERIQTTLDLSSQVNEENQDEGHAEPCQVKDEKSPGADNGNSESSQYAQVLAVKAPDFTSEESGSEEGQLNYTDSYFDTASVTENEKREDSNEMVPSSIQSNSLFMPSDSFDFGKNENSTELGSASEGDSPVLSVEVSETCLGEGESHLNGSSEVNMIESYFEGGSTNCGPAGIISGSAPDLAKHHHISNETNILGLSTSFNTNDHQYNALKQVQAHKSADASEVLEQYVAFGKCFRNYTPNRSESAPASLLNLQFPILEVKFASDAYSSSNSPLEALLASDTEAPPTDAAGDEDDVNTERIDDVITNGNGTTDVISINHPLVDVGVSSTDGWLDLEVPSHNLCAPSSPELNASLI